MLVDSLGQEGSKVGLGIQICSFHTVGCRVHSEVVLQVEVSPQRVVVLQSEVDPQIEVSPQHDISLQ
jgi:hypothetical protein